MQLEGFGFESRPGLLRTSVNEYQLRLGRQRQVWLIPIGDERMGVHSGVGTGGSGGSMNRGPKLLGPRVVGPQKNFRQDS